MNNGINFEETLREFSEYVEHLHNDDILAPEIKDSLQKKYGAPKKFSIDYSKIHLPSTEDYIEKAGDYLSHEQEKGFLDDFKQDEFKKEVSRNYYMRKSLAKKKAAKSKIINPDQLCKSEPYQKFWLNTSSVQKAIEQIKELPFIVQEDTFSIVSRLLELTSSYIRVMKHHNQIDNPKLTETQKNQIMQDFILKIREFYQIVVQEAISKHMINQRKFPKDQKDKFSFPEDYTEDPMPKKKKKKSVAFDDRDIHLLSQVTNPNLFPSCYRLNYDAIPNQIPTNQTKQQQKIFDQQTSDMLKTLHQNMTSLPPISKSAPPKSPRHIYDSSNNENEDNSHLANPKISKLLIIENDRPKRAITQPVSAKKSLAEQRKEKMDIERQRFLKEGWKGTERLDNRAGRPVSNLEVMDNITHNFGFNYYEYKKRGDNVKLPFSLTPTKPKEGPNLIDDIWNTANLSKTRSKSELQQKPKDPIPEKQKPKSKHNSIAQFKPSIMANLFNASESVRFLNKYSFEKIQKQQQNALNNEDFEDELAGNSISERLTNIWNELGFTPKQRLSLLIKYTESPDKSVDLKSALDFWENSLTSAKKYDRAYKELKNFLLNESDHLQHRTVIYDQMASEFNNSESSLSMISSALFSQYQDELIFHKKPVQQVIEKRAQKIKTLSIKKGLIEGESTREENDPNFEEFSIDESGIKS